MSAKDLIRVRESAPNRNTVFLPGLRVIFSYDEPVAFHDGTALVVSENRWATTTGKHLNAIDGGSKEARASRLPADQFEAALAAALKGVQW